MKNSTFKIQARISFVKKFDVPAFFGIFNKSYALDLPEVPVEFVIEEVSFEKLHSNITMSIDVDYLHSTKGKEFLKKYFAELSKLEPEYRERLLQGVSVNAFNYDFEVVIENKSSHKQHAILDAFELQGTKCLLHTAQVLKQPLSAGKTLILNNYADENFTEEYVYLADYWAVKDGEMVFHYENWEAENEDEANKISHSIVDSASFINQFNRIAHDIVDVLKKVANALNVDPDSLG